MNEVATHSRGRRYKYTNAFIGIDLNKLFPLNLLQPDSFD